MKRTIVFFHSKILAVFARVFIGGLLVFSAVNKLPVHDEFISIVQSFNILPDPLAKIYAILLPWVELLAGSFLILGIQMRPVAIVTLLTALSFLVANISSAVSGASFCGECFGKAISLPLPQAMALDIAMIIGAVYLYIAGRQPYSFDSLFISKVQRSKQTPNRKKSD